MSHLTDTAFVAMPISGSKIHFDSYTGWYSVSGVSHCGEAQVLVHIFVISTKHIADAVQFKNKLYVQNDSSILKQ